MFPLRICHISDIHLDIYASHLGSQKIIGNQNIYYIDRLNRFKKAINEAKDLKVDSIILSGDIFNKAKPTPREYEDLARLLYTIPENIEVFLLGGNHDEYSPQRSAPLEAFHGHRYHIATHSVITITSTKAGYVLAPWGSKIEDISKYLTMLPTDLPRIVIGHMAVKEAAYYFAELPEEQGGIALHDLQKLSCEAILLGHHHEQVKLSDTPTIWYAGSLEVIHDFNEEKQTKGWLLWEIEKNFVKVTPQTVDGPKFRTVDIDYLLATDPQEFADVYLRIRGELSLKNRPLLQSLLQILPVKGYKLDITLTGKKDHVEGLTRGAPSAILTDYLQRKKAGDIDELLTLDSKLTQKTLQGE